MSLLLVSFRAGNKDGKMVAEAAPMVVVVVEVVVVTFGYNGAAVSTLGALLIVPAEGAAVPVPRMAGGGAYVALGYSGISENEMGV